MRRTRVLTETRHHGQSVGLPRGTVSGPSLPPRAWEHEVASEAFVGQPPRG